jgi:hypothetical protein
MVRGPQFYAQLVWTEFKFDIDTFFLRLLVCYIRKQHEAWIKFKTQS